MTGMDMDRFDDAHQRSLENTGIQFGDVERLVIRQGLVVRLIGGMELAWEHFVQTAKGKRPVYCDGPEVGNCPICKLVAGWGMSDDATLQEMAGDIRAKERFYFNALDRSPQGRVLHSESKKTLLLTQNDKGMNVGTMVLQAIGSVCQMRKDQGKPNDPNCFDLMMQKQGSGFQTKYGANFTGEDAPLTPEELAYEKYDLKLFSALTSAADVEAIAAYLEASPDERSQAAADATGFDVNAMQAESDPAQAARDAIGTGATIAQATQATAVAQQAAQPAPAAAVAPVAAAAPAPAPAVAAPAPASPPDEQYNSTAFTDDYDPKKHYRVPCGSCGTMMQISLTDHRSMKCHGCERIYAHPMSADSKAK